MIVNTDCDRLQHRTRHSLGSVVNYLARRGGGREAQLLATRCAARCLLTTDDEIIEIKQCFLHNFVDPDDTLHNS